MAYSQYGRNGNEIGVNQCSNYIAGAGPGEGQSKIYNSTYAYNLADFETRYGYVSEQGKKLVQLEMNMAFMICQEEHGNM